MGPRMIRRFLAVCFLLMALTSGTADCDDEVPEDKDLNLTSLHRSKRFLTLSMGDFGRFMNFVYSTVNEKANLKIIVENLLTVTLENPKMSVRSGEVVSPPIPIKPCHTITVNGKISKESRGYITWDISDTGKTVTVSWMTSKQSNSSDDKKKGGLFSFVSNVDNKVRNTFAANTDHHVFHEVGHNNIKDTIDNEFLSVNGTQMPKRNGSDNYYEWSCKGTETYKVCAIMGGDSLEKVIRFRIQRADMADEGCEASLTDGVRQMTENQPQNTKAQKTRKTRRFHSHN